MSDLIDVSLALGGRKEEEDQSIDVSSILGSPEQPTQETQQAPIQEEDWGSVLEKTVQNLPDRARVGVNAIIQDFRQQYGNSVDATNDAAKIRLRLNRNPEDEEARNIATNLGVNPESLIGDPRATIDEFNKLSEAMRQEKLKSDPALQELISQAMDLQETLKQNAPQVEQWSAKGIVSNILGAGAEMLPSVIATAVTKKPIIGSGLIAGQVYGQSLAEGQQMGLSPDENRGRAIVNTLSEFFTEKVPLGELIKPGSGFVQGAARAGLSEGVQESLTQAVNEAYDAGIVGEETTLGEALNNIAFAGVVGAGVGTAFGAATTPLRGEAPTEEVIPETPLVEPQAPAEPLDNMVQQVVGPTAAAPGQDALEATMQMGQQFDDQIAESRAIESEIQEVPDYLDRFRASATGYPGEVEGLATVDQTLAEADVGLQELEAELQRAQAVFDEPAPEEKPVAQRREELQEKLNVQRVLGGIGEVQRALSRPAAPQAEQLISRAAETTGPTPQEVEFRQQQEKEFLEDAKNAKIPPSLREHERATSLRNKGYRSFLRDFREIASNTDKPTKFDSKTDSISEAAAKLGGLNREAAEAEGLDPASFKRNKAFPATGGKSFDEMAETLNQFNYRNREGGELTANDVVDLVSSEVNNQETHYSRDVDDIMLSEDAAAVREWSRELGGPDKLRTAITKALKGEKLGTKQTQVVGEMLDTIGAIRSEDVPAAIEALQTKRQERRAKEADNFNTLVNEALGREDSNIDFDGYSDFMATLPEESDEIDAAFVSIAERAADQNFESTDRVLERVENGEITAEQAVEELNTIIEGVPSEQVETAIEEQEPAAVEPVSAQPIEEAQPEPTAIEPEPASPAIETEEPESIRAREGRDEVKEISSAVYKAAGVDSFYDGDDFNFDAYDSAVDDAEYEISEGAFNYWQNSNWQESTKAYLSQGDRGKFIDAHKKIKVYHGSPDVDLTNLERKSNTTAFVAKTEDAAKEYAKGGQVYETTIEPKNPFIIRDDEATYDMEGNTELIEELREEGYDSIIALNGDDIVILTDDPITNPLSKPGEVVADIEVKEEERQDQPYTFNFGKHKGKTLSQVAEEAPDYIDWIKGKKGFDRTRPDLIEAINQLEGQQDVPSTTRDLEPSRAAVSDTVDQGASAEQRRNRAREASDQVTSDLGEARTKLADSSGVPLNSPLDVGTEEPDAISELDEQPSDEIGVTGDVDSRGSANNGDERLSPESDAAKAIFEEAKQRSRETRTDKQLKADEVKVSFNDPQNIADTLPLLTEEQISDVVNAERRLYGEGKKGILFTNGTGTGKTYTGTGVAKRAVQAGQKVLVVAPKGTIGGWQGAAKDMNFEYVKIANKSTGAGDNAAAITTYQNFADNTEIMQEKFDLVIYDESHKLMANMQGDATKATVAHYGLTKEGSSRGSLVYAPEFDKLSKDVKAYIKKQKEKGEKVSEADAYRLPRFAKRRTAIWNKKERLDRKFDKIEAESPTKVLFLSATPFSGHKSVFYGDGYIFETDEGYKDKGGYNSGNPQQQFLVNNFGYRMKYNKANTPGADVDVGLLERDWADQMFDSGAMVGRVLNLAHDYSREFVVVEPGVGSKVDELFEYVNYKDFPELSKELVEWRKNGMDRQLAEALRVRGSLDRIEQHLNLGRKVVVFHQRMNINIDDPLGTGFKTEKAIAEINQLKKSRSDLYNIDFSDLSSAPDQIVERFGRDRVALFNGENTKDRNKELKEFNKDGGEKDIIVISKDAGKEGLSAHDITGANQRALIITNTPQSPADAIQMEGRIYRFGLMTNAVIEYPSVQTNFEKIAFRDTVSRRTATAENLAMGSQARLLRESFRDGYMEPRLTSPDSKQGSGGKSKDRNTNEVTEFDRAKTYYFKRAQRTQGTKSEEGQDYFATPEPVGLSMVNFARLVPGEKALEPSAGHGAIARWLPESTTNLMIEQSPQLIGELSLLTDGDVKNSDFEDLNIINKFDAVVMNPPFGTGGSVAIPHLDKAFKHLTDGGRVVALLPEGGNAGKRFDKWYEEAEGAYITGEISLPSVTFKRAGTGVKTKIVIIDKDMKGGNVTDGSINYDFSNITDVNELFDSLNQVESLPRPDVSISGNEVGLNTEERDGKFIAELTEFRTSGKARQLGKRELKKLAEKYFGEVVSKRDIWDVTTYTFDNAKERNSFFKAIIEQTQPKKLGQITKQKAKGIPRESVQKEIDSFLKDYAGVAPVNFAIADTQNELPVNVETGQSVKALYNPADISLVLVAENFNSASEVRKTLQHELVVHYGLRALMGRDKYNMHLDRLVRSKDKRFKSIMDQVKSDYNNFINTDTKQGQRILAEEALARMAEGDLQVGAVKRFVNAVLKVLKSIKLMPDTATYVDAVDLIQSNAQGLRSRAIDVSQVDTTPLDSDLDQNPYLASLHSEYSVKNAPVSDELKKQINKVHYAGDTRSFVQRVKDRLAFDRKAVRQGLIDQFESIKAYEVDKFGDVLSAEDSAYKQATLSTDTAAIVETALKHGVPKFVNGNISMREGVKPLQEVIAQVTDLDENLLPVWTHWLAAKRVKDQKLIEQGKEKLFTQEMVDEIFAEVNGNAEIKRVFEQAQKDYAKFNSATLDFAQESGLIDPEQRVMWESDSYVPFYRIAEETAKQGGPFGKKGIEGQTAGIRQLKGGTDKLNILESMVQNPMHLISASFKNIAMDKVVELTEDVAMSKVPNTWKPISIDNRQIAKALEEIGIEFEDLTPAQKAQYSTLFQMNAPQGENIVSVMREGKREYYEVEDPLLLNAVTALGPQPVNEIVRLMGIPKRLLTNMVTATPPFMVRNFIRDVVSNYVQADKSTGTTTKDTVFDAALLRPFGRSLSGMKASIKEDKDRWQIMAAGGMSGEYFGSSNEDVALDLLKSTKKGIAGTARRMFNNYQHVVRASEEATRIAVYRQVKENGGSDFEAAYQAKNVINFSRSGQYKAVQFLIQTVPFFNARVQGLDRLYQGAKANPAAFAMRGALLFAATMALMAANDDREEYWALNEHERDTYWHAWVDGVHIRIPKPFEVGAMFATIPERMYEAATREEKVFLSRMGSMFMDTFSMNPIPQVFSPIVEQVANRSFFLDRPIVSMSLQNLSPEMQFTTRTSLVSRYMAELMPDFMPDWARSPVRIEHVINSYFGTVGGYTLMTGDWMAKHFVDSPVMPAKRVTDYPLISDFIRNGERSTKYVGRFYDMVSKSNEVNRSIRQLEEQERKDEAKKEREKYGSILQVRRTLNKTRARITKINNQINKVYRNQIMSAEAKRRRIEKLKAQKNEITKQISDKYWRLF